MINDKLDPERGRKWTPNVAVSEILEEVNKLGSSVKNMEENEASDKSGTKQVLATELSNLLYEVFVLAEHYRIELEESFLQTVNDYMLKFIK
jgi:NTP pyrophosphatase (non-canonical NTP hydrolase)